MSLTTSQKNQFGREGYVIVENALKSCDLDPLIQRYTEFINTRASQLMLLGKIKKDYKSLNFEERLAKLSRHDLSIHKDIDLMHVRGSAVFNFLINDRLLDLIEPIIGPEILCSPIQHVRAKLPESLRTEADKNIDQAELENAINGDVAPWHQDAQVHLEDADPSYILTVWLPLCDTTPENGCLQIIPGQHVRDTVFWSEGFGISDLNLPKTPVKTLPMQKGSVLLMHKLIPHRSTPNYTDSIRWSLDLRYQPIGTPTGRPFYPAFEARSRINPGTELRNYSEWDRAWNRALSTTAPSARPRRSERPIKPSSMLGADGAFPKP